MIDAANEWYFINNAEEIDSPALLVYPDRVKENIRLLKARVEDVLTLRPHVKTNKMAEVCQMMLDEGIAKFKCATIAEAEMLAMVCARDVLLACQPVGPKIGRLIRLAKRYPSTRFSYLIDDASIAENVNGQCAETNTVLGAFIDVNVGMNRTGASPAGVPALFERCLKLSHISLKGLHVYDGHITDSDLELRQQKSDAAFADIRELFRNIVQRFHFEPVIVVGGSPSFATHVMRKNVEFSPGTFVFWDWGYKNSLPEEPYNYAALVLCRVVSVIDAHTVCVDLGHKSVAAENALPRVHFLNAPEAVPVRQSEEHLVLTVDDSFAYPVGFVLYGVPVHICPTVALYEKAIMVEGNRASGEWQVIARDRKIKV